jgi:uncharacterized protein (DUF1697 family)
MPTTYLALFRGINVGGKNKLPMKDLAEMFVEAGCVDVRTFIQSGNVVFRAISGVARRVPELVTARVGERFGHRPPIVLRTTEQLADVFRNNPFLEMGAAEDTLFVLFLADQPSAAAVAALDPERSPGDTYIVRGKDIYLRLSTGAADTKLTNAYFDSKLATVSTGRNLRTVTKLLDLMKT